MLFAPTNLSVGARNVSYAGLWDEGLWTHDPQKGMFLGQKVESAPSFDKESLMLESSLTSVGSFNGTMNTKLNKQGSVYLEQTLRGDFKIDTAVSVYTSAKHLYPHINISKEAFMLDEDTVLFLINVSNDGNKLLRPVIVTDRLPEGLTFINASIKPKINGQIINWTIPSLEIGRKLTIKLRARVDPGRRFYRNTVSASGTSKDGIVDASNFTVFEAYYQPLPCCLGADIGLNESKLLNETPVIGDWGLWKPAPCFNVSTDNIDCARMIEEYYDELEKNMTECSCASNYGVP
ncbi:Uncharacterised protein [uncultured archaeon]|nr:Uncharacterised protein [uncultured archaeon]